MPGALTCFVPCLEPALWPQPEGEAALREVTRQLLPRADIVLLTTEELEFLFGTAEMRVALFPLLRGHTQLVLLARAEGIHAFTRTNHAFWPGLSLPAPRLAAKALCCLLQKTARGKTAPPHHQAVTNDLIRNAQSPRRPAGALLRKVSNQEKIVGCLVSG